MSEDEEEDDYENETADETEGEEEVAAEKQPKAKTGNDLYHKYIDLQNSYPDCIIAYRLGDFYEVFGEKAEVIADELDLTLRQGYGA